MTAYKSFEEEKTWDLQRVILLVVVYLFNKKDYTLFLLDTGVHVFCHLIWECSSQDDENQKYIIYCNNNLSLCYKRIRIFLEATSSHVVIVKNDMNFVV